MKKAYLFLLFMMSIFYRGFAQDVINEGFEGSVFPPAGWTTSAVSDDPAWTGWMRANTAHSGTYSAFVEWASDGHESYMITPQLSLSGHKVLSFWVASDYGSWVDNTTLTVETSTATNAIEDFTVLQTVTLPTQDYQFVNVIIDLLPYSGQTLYLAFHIQDDYGTGVYLDDIHIYDLPTCYAPTNLAVSNVGTTSATVSWTGDSNVSAYVVDRMDMSKPTAPSVLDTVTGTTFNMTGLQPTTNYQMRVKSICADQSASTWSNVVTFMTLCSPINVTAEQIWQEGFEEYSGGSTAPLNSCWATPVISTTYNTPYCICNWPTAAQSGVNALDLRGDDGQANMVLLPAFTNALNTLRLGFYANTSSVSVANSGSLTVGYVTDESNPSSFVPLFSVTPNDSSLGRAYSVYYGPFDFIAAPANATRMAIRYVSNAWSVSWDLDDISVSLIPECSAPTQLNVTNITPTSANLFWIGQSAPTYQLLYWESGSTDTTVLTNVAYNSNGYALTNLTENTTYEWTVKTVCANGTIYPAATVLSFTTPFNASDLPYLQTFDDVDLSDITEYNIFGTGGNQWAIGSATGHPGNSLYISSDNGISNNYEGTSAYSYAELDLTFPTGSYEYHLSFDYKVVGEPGFDEFSVYLADENAVVTPGAVPPGTALLYEAYNVSEWTSVDFTLFNVAGTTKKIIFFWTNDYIIFNNPPVAVDNISVSYYTCLQPSNISANNITDDGARISWLENGDATAWTVFYRPVYSNEPYMEAYAYNTPTTTLMDLYSNTMYECYVVADCNDGQHSSESPHFTFRTLCGNDGITLLPFFEDFSNYIHINGSDYVSCWTRLTSNSQHYVYVNREDYESECLDFHYTPNCYTMAVLPMLNSSIPVNSVAVSFDVRRGSLTGGPLELGVLTDPNNPSTFEVIDTINLTYSNYWENHQVLCDNYTGSGSYLAFRVNNAGNNPVMIDNLLVDYLPTCLPASNLTVSNLTMTSATISWTANGYDYGVYVIGADTTYYAARDSYITLTNLQPSSSYSVIVVTYCGSDTANASNPMTFFTPCGLITVSEESPWLETFESYMGGPLTAIDFSPCWAKPVSYTDASGTYPSVYNYEHAAHSGEKAVRFKGYNNMLVLPEFANDINTLRFSFWANTTSASPVGRGLMEVGVVSNGAATFIPVDTVDITAYSVQGTDSENADFMGPFDFNVIDNIQPGMRIAIRYQTEYFDVACYLDDFTVSLIPDCPSPMKSSVAISDITSNSALVTWEDRDASHTQWVVYYKESDDDNASWMTTSSYTMSATLYNLTPNTYYDVYVVTKCGTYPSEDATRVKHFCTVLVPESLPYTADFSDLASWKLDNANCTSRWMQGQLSDGTYALYVTENDSTPGYSDSPSSLVVAEKMFLIGTNNEVAIDFDVQVGGESDTWGDFDFMKLFLAPASSIFEASDLLVDQPLWSYPDYATYAYNFTEYFSQATCSQIKPYKYALTNGTVHVSALMHNPNPNPSETSTAKVVFVWKNDYSGGTQPGAVISNLTVQPVICPQPTNVVASNVGPNSADITWTPGQNESEWVISYKAENETTWTDITVTVPMYQLTGLTPHTTYNVRVASNCGGGQTSLYTYASFLTSTCDVEDQCTYTLTLVDSYGDGWNDAYVEVRQNGLTIGTYSLQAGTNPVSDAIDLMVCTNSTVSLVWHEGSYDYECGLTLIGPDGTVLYTVGSINANTGTAIYTFLAQCPTTVPCPSPLGLTVSSVTNNSAMITWLAGSANSWLLQYKESSAGSWQPAIPVNNNTYTLTGLTPSTTYLLQVKALCDDDESEWTQSVQFMTAAPSTAIEPTIETRAASNIASTSAMMNGEITDLGNQTIVSRGFEWKETSSDTFALVEATGTVMSYFLTDLSANTSYTYRAFVTTVNTTTYGSDMVFTTLPMPCQAPTNLAQLSVTDNSVTVVWTNHAESDEWQLRYRSGNNDWEVLNMTTTYYQLSGLAPNTTYELQVRSICDNETTSEWSTSLFVTTVGIENYLQSQITLMPNPAKEYLNVKCTMNNVPLEGAEIELLDMYGKLLQTIAISSENTQINVSGLASGVYFVRVNTKEGQVTKRFVKE
ncbi:MAG: fibronectin type III domain-containing protein [Bacteroidales bacterium]|nr:fibronectin type III domain-containing protein [Bacteroidales bacterium]